MHYSLGALRDCARETARANDLSRTAAQADPVELEARFIDGASERFERNCCDNCVESANLSDIDLSMFQSDFAIDPQVQAPMALR